MSYTASVHSPKEVPPVERAQLVETVDEYEDAEKNFQPKSLKFWTIIIGMYLSIFLVALVNFAVRLYTHTSSLHASRIELSLQRPFHASPTNSTLSRTSVGMAVPTC